MKKKSRRCDTFVPHTIFTLAPPTNSLNYPLDNCRTSCCAKIGSPLLSIDQRQGLHAIKIEIDVAKAIKSVN
jgi:hypothetical protein